MGAVFSVFIAVSRERRAAFGAGKFVHGFFLHAVGVFCPPLFAAGLRAKNTPLDVFFLDYRFAALLAMFAGFARQAAPLAIRLDRA